MDSGSTPVILGGDASVSACIIGASGVRSPQAIVHLCFAELGHERLGTCPGSPLGSVSKQGQTEVCHITCPTSKRHADAGSTHREVIEKYRASIDATLPAGALRNGRPRAHLSIDVGALSRFAKQRPGEWMPPSMLLMTDRFKRILTDVCRSFSVVSIDLVEAGSRGRYTRVLAHSCCQLLLLAMSAVSESRGPRK